MYEETKNTLKEYLTDKGEKILVMVNPQGRGTQFNPETQTLTPIDMRGLTEVPKGRTSASTQKRADDKTNRSDSQGITSSLLKDILLDPKSKDASGLKPGALVGGYSGGLLMGDKGAEYQSKRTSMDAVTFEALAPALANLGKNPTDFDFKVALGTVPDKNKDMRTWIDWYRTRYIPTVRNFTTRNLQEGNSTITAAELSVMIADMEQTAQQAEEIHYPQASKDTGMSAQDMSRLEFLRAKRGQ